MKNIISSISSEQIVHAFTKEEIESFAAMDLNEFINWIMETNGNYISPIMIQYLKRIHKMCVDAVANNKPPMDS